MSPKLRLWALSCLLAVWSQAALASEWSTRAQCDNADAPLKVLKAEALGDCQKACEGEQSCGGVVYVSGWKKCQLKGSVKKQAFLRFQSGILDEGHRYVARSFKDDHDHSGKDLERLVLGDAEACGNACEGRQDCAAFTYLDGYRVCWLKKKGGRFVPKVFTCAWR